MAVLWSEGFDGWVVEWFQVVGVALAAGGIGARSPMITIMKSTLPSFSFVLGRPETGASGERPGSFGPDFVLHHAPRFQNNIVQIWNMKHELNMNAERASVDIKVRARHGSAVGRFARAFTRARSLDAEGDGVGMVASTSSGRRRGTLPGLGVGGLLHAEKEDHVSGETTLIHGFLMKKARSKKGSWLGPLQRHNWQERYVALMLPETPYATSSKLLYFHLDNHDEVADAMGVITICRDTTVTPHVSRHGYKHCFYVSGGHGKDKRGVALRASSETEYQKWVTAIRDLCHTLHAEDDDDVSGDDGDGSDEEEEQEMVVMKGEVEEEKESGASKKKEASSAADSSSGGGNWTAKPEFSIALISAAVAVILALAYGPMRAHPSGRFGAFALGLFSALVLVVAPALLLWEGDARGDGGDESAAVKAKEARACLVVKKEKTRRERKVRKKRDGKAKAVQTSTAQVRTEEAMSFVGVEDFGNVVKEDAAEVLSLVLGEAYGDNTAAAVVEEKTRTSIFGMTTGSKKNKSSPRLASEVADWFVRRSSAEDRLTMAWRYFRFNHGDVHRWAFLFSLCPPCPFDLPRLRSASRLHLLPQSRHVPAHVCRVCAFYHRPPWLGAQDDAVAAPQGASTRSTGYDRGETAHKRGVSCRRLQPRKPVRSDTRRGRARDDPEPHVDHHEQ